MGITYEGVTEQFRQIVHHHAVLRRGLERHAGTLCDAVASGVPFQRQLAALLGYLEEEVLPHAEAEERILYRAAARPGSRQRTGPHPDRRAPRTGIPRWTAPARRGQRRGRDGLGMDRDAVRRTRGQGKRPAASRAHRLRRGPGGPARRHAQAAAAGPRIRKATRSVLTALAVPAISSPGGEIIMYPNNRALSGATRHHGRCCRRVAGGMAHPGGPRRPAAARHIRGREHRAARGGNSGDRDAASS